jgi:hypothetical protein
MKRREFFLATAGAALVVAVPAVSTALSRRALLDDPQAWLGDEFLLADGARLRLAGVEHLQCDEHCTQARLQFSMVAGAAPAEGAHELRSASGCESVFLQAGRAGPVACINRLRGAA